VQRFERPRTGGDPGSCLDSDALIQSDCAGDAATLVQRIAALHRDAIDPRSPWRTPARSRGPPASHR
jgi:hypothetical protein